MDNREVRVFLFSTLSLLVTAVFAGYNVFLWFAYGAAWNIGIAVYYGLLTEIRACILIVEERLRRKELTEEQKGAVRIKMYFVQSIFLFAVDVALIAPISLMVLQEKAIGYTAIPAIAIAAYTTYKIALSTVNYVKNRRERQLSVKMCRNLNFMDALVSVLSLQYVLVMTFGDGVTGEMMTWCAISSFAVWAALLAVAFAAMMRAIELKRKSGRGEEQANRL